MIGDIPHLSFFTTQLVLRYFLCNSDANTCMTKKERATHSLKKYDGMISYYHEKAYAICYMPRKIKNILVTQLK